MTDNYMTDKVYNIHYQLTYLNTEDENYNIDLLNVFYINDDDNDDLDKIFNIISSKIETIYELIKDELLFIDYLNSYKENYTFLDNNLDLFIVLFEYKLFYKTHELLYNILSKK
jgi:hypothetical protein